MKYEQAFYLKPNAEGLFDVEKSKEQVKIWDSIQFLWVLQVFSTIIDLFKHLVSLLS